MCHTYEPSSEPLHISVKKIFSFRPRATQKVLKNLFEFVFENSSQAETLTLDGFLVRGSLDGSVLLSNLEMRGPTADSERRGKNVKRYKVWHLKAKANIWPWLSYMCRIHSTAAESLNTSPPRYRGTSTIRKRPTPLGPPQEHRYRPTVGS